MSITYTITTNFGAKDALPTGDSDKVIKGSQFTTEFTSIQTAFGLCAPAASPAFTGTISYNGTNITSTAAELNALDGFTGTVADLNYAAALNATGVTTTEFDKLDGLTATTTELNYNDITTLGTVQANKTVTAASSAINFNNFDMTNVDINSGAIDGTSIGSSSPNTGAFTTLTASTYSGLPAATTSVAGISEMATSTEVNTGTSTTRAVTPDALADSQYQKIETLVINGDGTILNSTGGTWTVTNYASDTSKATFDLAFPSTAGSAYSQVLSTSIVLLVDSGSQGNLTVPLREVGVSGCKVTIPVLYSDDDLTKTELHIMRIVLG